ncbi:TetR/AcrR family transcriptional regulator [Naumannella sp. ID2617S]|uniref:TetR family transcriptional regulator n=1 Tax=Enemella dayhoffiae TaxID=2016507 RepID=A0A255HCA6_9ACTN|nr:TetR/AcrR family transcriptional regulator [Enemella dayhoffiae]NNG20136.1 TetR/AcrR family transcriptional regulator [Naumannella sp. ID2617S]OYO25337.1 TetR family transcriptional regulator [Enemella dayhoffiae]
MDENRVDGRTARRTETREAVLNAATELFAAQGVSATSVDEIAARAGTAKGSVFYNFGSKNGVVEALMQRSIQRLATNLAEATHGLSGRELRRETVANLLREVHAHPNAAQLMVNETFRVDRSWSETTRQWRGLMLSGLVEDYVAEHGEDHRERAGLWAAALVGATLMTGLEWMVAMPAMSYDDARAALLETLHL